MLLKDCPSFHIDFMQQLGHGTSLVRLNMEIEEPLTVFMW